MGVSFFRESAPDDFATFGRSFYALCVLVLESRRASVTNPFIRSDHSSRVGTQRRASSRFNGPLTVNGPTQASSLEGIYIRTGLAIMMEYGRKAET